MQVCRVFTVKGKQFARCVYGKVDALSCLFLLTRLNRDASMMVLLKRRKMSERGENTLPMMRIVKLYILTQAICLQCNSRLVCRLL